ncbi:hypothetical protein JMUB7547_28420 [Staphylococcus aureus]
MGIIGWRLIGERSSFKYVVCLLYTSDAADEARSVDLGGRRIIKKMFFLKVLTAMVQ